jgi:hypothetical protein
MAAEAFRTGYDLASSWSREKLDIYFWLNATPEPSRATPYQFIEMGELGSGLFNPQEFWSLDANVGLHFTSAQRWYRIDPLVLDLDGDGIETVGVNLSSPILFDHNADGIRTGTGWIAADDGLLVLDRNGNGLIDNGTELFGDATPLPDGTTAADGFAALAPLDANGDGSVDAADPQFADLRLWRDLDQDAATDAGELHPLASLGIARASAKARDLWEAANDDRFAVAA